MISTDVYGKCWRKTSIGHVCFSVMELGSILILFGVFAWTLNLKHCFQAKEKSYHPTYF